MHVRAAAAVDAPAIAEVHVRAWQEAYAGQLPQAFLDGLTAAARISMWRTMLAPGADPDVLVAVDEDGTLVGFVAVDDGEVSAIYVRQRWWDAGIGRMLMASGLDRLRARGATTATLWVLETNARARRFYERGGWDHDGTTRAEEIGGIAVTELRYSRSLLDGG